jgi:hypothetical protein
MIRERASLPRTGSVLGGERRVTRPSRLARTRFPSPPERLDGVSSTLERKAKALSTPGEVKRPRLVERSRRA